MDEQSFDDLIKRKLQDYKDPGSDYAFNELKSRLATRTPILSSKGLLYTAVTAMLLLTGLNVALTFHSPEVEHNNADKSPIDSLLNVITQLKEDSKFLKEQLACIQEENMSAQKQDNSPGKSFILNATEDVAPTNDQPQQAILKYRNTSDLHNFSVPILLPGAKFIFVEKSPFKSRSEKRQEISAKTKNKLERHYFTGIGINVAPQIALSAFKVNSSTLMPSPAVGIGIDWILSPHLSVETNLKYASLDHKIDKRDPAYQNLNDNYYGTPIEVKRHDNAVIGSALLGYRQWINHRDEITIKVGVSRYEMLHGKHNITYAQPGYIDPDDRGSITLVRGIDGLRNLGNTLSLNLGLSRQLDRNHKMELSAFYDYGIRKSGIQNLGIRASLWFKAR